MNDITAMVCNWMTAERTKNAVNSFRQFYSDVPLIIVNDGPNNSIAGGYFSSRPSDIDLDTSKLEDLGEFVDCGEHLSHGGAINEGVKHINTKWFFLFDSDIIFKKGGFLEKMIPEEMVSAVGLGKTQHSDFPKISNHAVLYRADLARKFKLSFKSIQYTDDGEIIYFHPYNDKVPSGTGLEAGTGYVHELRTRGYSIKEFPINYYYEHSPV